MNTERKLTKCINPATFDIIAEIPEHTTEELQSAIASSREAQKVWSRMPLPERKAALRKVAGYIASHADELAKTISDATGKTRIDAMSTEVLPSAMAVSYYAKRAGSILKKKRLMPGNILLANKWTYVTRVPYGVVGIISPWNYPFGIPFHEVAMALMAGNGVVLKVASQTLTVGNAIAECVAAAGLPEGLFAHVNLPGKIAGDAMIDGGVDKLCFTGSVPVGKYLMKKAADRLLPISLELGGNDAMIVCADANIKRAAGGALWAGLSNSGQSCAGVERIFVESKIYDEFVRELKSQLTKLRQGNDVDFSVEIGSLTTAGQLETVRAHFKDATEKGAEIFVGQSKQGENNIGYFHPPVILEKVTPDMLTMEEETFGPLLTVDSFTTIEEAVLKANSGKLGLTASVWTENKKLAHEMAAKLESGAITINDHLMSHGMAESPWGGFKESGFGRTHSYLGLEAMTQPRAVIDDVMPGLQKNLWWYPHSKEVYMGLRGALHFLYHHNLSKRVEGFVNTIKLFLKCF
ncbi:MAG: aldehyde dehydrogenase family protein [Ignavibacteriales bacterium]|nr:aldehyde dehydrogenase family protein [Ignavibacteriales bacterium]